MPDLSEVSALFCCVCEGEIQGKYTYNHWGENAHAKHQGVMTAQCATCARFISRHTQQGIQYADGRVSCGLCQMTSVTEAVSVEHSRQRVLDRLNSVGFDYIPDYIAVTLTDQRRLNQRLGTHGNSYGLTKTLEKKENGVITYREHSIFILYGLPRLVFESVLAHELLHVWLNERPLSHQRSSAEIEGFCNLGSHLIYADAQTPLAKYLLERMQQNPDVIYGKGYRQQYQRLQSLGWNELRAFMQRPAPLKNTLKKVDRWLERFNL